jgi:hypothetical protein
MAGLAAIDSGMSMPGTCNAFETVVTDRYCAPATEWETTDDRYPLYRIRSC